MDYKEEFIKFLEDNNAREKFEENLKPICLESYLGSGWAEKYIIGAFIWKDDEVDFWDTLNDKWYEQLNTLNLCTN